MRPLKASTLRAALMAVLVLGLIGTTIELVLMEHYQSVSQFIPIGLTLLALAISVWHGRRPGAGSLFALRVTMTLLIAAGLLGVWYHFNGSAAFQLEIDPSLQGWPLFLKVIQAHAPPLLAPGVMIQMGLIGLVYTLHPTE